ncbi:hypothetical protein P168DRAFT_307126 [Aspergillus campestris IBT 28561]|uniref:Uncharacterized protein n=1 Tax=Aspergillus campestris (strain IBT 28561) TaxID=1392248 RepID=A0A2I1CUH8_ASPC2|nr:uncharacterized protein P168DRAFT_307126 [Aspergillus campestris IBT 28561]PKY01286.1 hypothetical protein P168DRAFT_307126 [Aspergillus campestris IBT 28561]
MESQQYNAADLTSVLRTLSALSSHPPPPEKDSPATAHHTHVKDDEPEDEDTYEPTDSLPLSTPAPAPQTPQGKQQQQLSSHRPPQPAQQHPPPPPPPGTKVDISTITTWPSALRHVMRTVGQNESIQQRIRFLIQRQHDHEKQWWRGRVALVEKQKARAEKKKELDEVLRSVGAPVDSKQVSTAEEDHAELTNYDTKVYRASTQMADAMASELRALQIPFFYRNGRPSAHDPAGTTPRRAGTDAPPAAPLSGDELVTLQRRMLELLQDLCKE